MPPARAGGRHHRIAYLGGNDYRLSWSYEVKYGRLLSHRRMTRDTDRKGAERFAKKWGVPMPNDRASTG
jgi:hypothetical protein